MANANNMTAPATLASLPYLYADNYGTFYAFYSTSNQGCIDTVYPMTANAGGTYNVKGVPLYAGPALGVIGDANHQYGPVFMACQSLLNQVQGASTSTSSISALNIYQDLFGSVLTGNWLVDDILLIAGVMIAIGVLEWFADVIGFDGFKRRK